MEGPPQALSPRVLVGPIELGTRVPSSNFTQLWEEGRPGFSSLQAALAGVLSTERWQVGWLVIAQA